MHQQQAPPRLGPWVVKERPAGDWVVDRLDRETMRCRRHGPFSTEQAARDRLADITEPAS